LFALHFACHFPSFPSSATMSMLRVARVALARSTPMVQQRVVLAAAPLSRSMSDFTPAPAAETDLRGRQREELVDLGGVAGFNDQPALGPFGTVAAPVRIYSSFHSRYVGCKGGDDQKHRLLWFELKAGPKHVCTECGQVFQLITPHDSADAHAHKH